MPQNQLTTSTIAIDCQTSLAKFKQITKNYSLFHYVFLIIAFLELFCLFLFFSFFAQSSYLALSLGALFFTGFSYCVLLFYFQGKKPEQLLALKENYITSCKTALSYTASAEHRLSLANELYRFVNALHSLEYSYYKLPSFLKTIEPLLEKLSVWTYWKEVHNMKEILLLEAIDEHLELVKSNPIDLEPHAHLAENYITLANLYRSPNKSWVPSAYLSYEMQQKFKLFMERALEEFKIICHFSPESAWVYSQLAFTYHELHQPAQEIKEYENLLNLLPNDKEVLLRLGTLYFQQGHSALGLRIYSQLQTLDPAQAKILISFYAAFLKT